MEEIDQIPDSLPRDEEQTTDPAEQLENQDNDTPSDKEAASSEDEAAASSSNRRPFVFRGRVETGTPPSSANTKRTRRVIAALGRPQTGNHTPQGPTAALGGPSNLRAPPVVPEGAISALGRPLYPPSRESMADIEVSTAQVEPRGK